MAGAAQVPGYAVAAAFPLGFAAGLLGTLLGIGGGVLMVPVLILMGVSAKVAAPASLVAILGTSLGGLRRLLRRGLVDWRLAVFLETASGLGAVTGVKLVGVMSERGLILFWVLALIGSGFGFLFYERLPLGRRVEKGLSASPLRLALAWLVSFVAGLLSAMLGIGGGLIKVPVLVLVVGLPVKVAVATSKLMVGITASVGVIGYILEGLVVWSLAVPLALGTYLGASLSARLLVRAPERAVRLLAASYYFVMAFVLLLRYHALL